MPFHEVNDRMIDRIVGTQTSARTMNVGTPMRKPRTILSVRVKTDRRRRRPVGAGVAAVAAVEVAMS